MFGITFETAILALRCNFSGIACDSLGYPPSSLLQLFRLYSDIKGVQFNLGQEFYMLNLEYFTMLRIELGSLLCLSQS